MEIEIVITHNGEEITKANALSFESAEEELGKLERYCKTNNFCRKCGDFISVESGYGIANNEEYALCASCLR